MLHIVSTSHADAKVKRLSENNERCRSWRNDFSSTVKSARRIRARSHYELHALKNFKNPQICKLRRTVVPYLLLKKKNTFTEEKFRMYVGEGEREEFTPDCFLIQFS